MYASSEKKLDILNDHYKDTFSHLLIYRKQRDRLLMYLLINVVIISIYVFYPERTPDAISEAVSKKIGISLTSIDPVLILIIPEILGCIIMFKQLQLSLLIQRQRFYLEELEKDLTTLFPGGVAFTRETNFSLEERRNLSVWSNIPYIWFFSILFCWMALLFLWLVYQRNGFSATWYVCFGIWLLLTFYLAYRIFWALRQKRKMQRKFNT